MDKNNKVKFDKRFKMYKPKVQEDLDLSDIKDLANSTEDFITEETEMRSFSQFIKEDWVCGQCSCDPCTCGEENLSEDAAGKSLKSKAEKSGMPTSVLRQVYNRGVAAWKTGHRPGTTPEQWGHARVNSFITKSKGTWGKADKDLADKVRGSSKKEEAEQLDELSPETLKSYKKKAMKQYTQSANKRNPGGGNYGSATKAAQDKHQKRFDKRHKGIGSEIKRTTDSDIHLKDPKGLVRKDPKSNSMTGKPAPYKNRAESKVNEAIMSNQLDELTAAEKKLINQMYDKKGNLTPMGKKVMDHGKANSKLTPKNRDADNARRKEYNAYQKSKRNEEVESTLDEAPRRKGAPKMTGDSIAIQRAKDAEHNKAMGRTKTGRKKPVRTMTSTQRSLAQLRGEETIEEKNGLWANIHAKRARGEKMRKKGEEGAPTPEAIKRAQESFSEDLDAIMSNLDMVNEVAGAGEQGTPELTKKYKKDTPMEDKK